jgi:hypothetical protein
MSDKLTQEDYLIQAHEEYIQKTNESGMPLWVCDLYGPFIYSSSHLLCSSSNGDRRDAPAGSSENIPSTNDNQDLPF